MKFVASDPNLKPCPHCPESIVSTCKDHGSRRWQVICGACGSATGLHVTEAEAIAAWNRRAPTEIERTSKALIEADDARTKAWEEADEDEAYIADEERYDAAYAAWRKAVKGI